MHLPPERARRAVRAATASAWSAATPRGLGAPASCRCSATGVAFLAGSFVRALARCGPTSSTRTTRRCWRRGSSARALAARRLVYDSHELATGVPYRERFWARVRRGARADRAAALRGGDHGLGRHRRPAAGALRAAASARRSCATCRTSTRAARRASAGPARASSGSGRRRSSCTRAPWRRDAAARRSCGRVAQLPDAHLVFLGDAVAELRGVVERFAARAGRRATGCTSCPSVPVERAARLHARGRRRRLAARGRLREPPARAARTRCSSTSPPACRSW